GSSSSGCFSGASFTPSSVHSSSTSCDTATRCGAPLTRGSPATSGLPYNTTPRTLGVSVGRGIARASAGLPTAGCATQRTCDGTPRLRDGERALDQGGVRHAQQEPLPLQARAQRLVQAQPRHDGVPPRPRPSC